MIHLPTYLTKKKQREVTKFNLIEYLDILFNQCRDLFFYDDNHDTNVCDFFNVATSVANFLDHDSNPSYDINRFYHEFVSKLEKDEHIKTAFVDNKCKYATINWNCFYNSVEEIGITLFDSPGTVNILKKLDFNFEKVSQIENNNIKLLKYLEALCDDPKLSRLIYWKYLFGRLERYPFNSFLSKPTGNEKEVATIMRFAQPFLKYATSHMIATLKVWQGQTYLKEFELLYKENENKLYMTKTYPIDENKFTHWINCHPTTCSKWMATLFRRYTRHVPFTEFQDTLYRVCHDIKIKIQKEGYKNVVLFIPLKGLFKSNLWVALLSFKILHDTITHVVVNPKQIKTFVETPKLHLNQKTIFLYPDDCSYSGKQVREFTVYELMTYGISKKIDVMLLIPFITSQAISHIQDSNYNCKILTSDAAELVNTFDTQIYKKQDNRDILNQCKTEFEQIINSSLSNDAHRCTLYFDHKLADDMSVFNVVYNTGILLYAPENSQEEKLSEELANKMFTFQSLISNCQCFVQAKDVISKTITEACADINKKLVNDEVHNCPRAFYKQITYTFNNRLLSASLEEIGQILLQ